MPRTGSIASNVGPAVSRKRLPREDLRLRRRHHGGEDLVGLLHAALAGLAARLLAGARAEHDDAVGDELRDVALIRGVRPHLPVHRRRDDQRAIARERERGQEIVGVTVGDLREKVRRRRGDDDRIGAARQVDVAHSVVGARRPQIGEHRPAGQRLQRQRRDEAARGVRHADVDGHPGLDEQPRQLGGLVRGDAAGDAQDDSRQRHEFECPEAHERCDGAKFTLLCPGSPSGDAGKNYTIAELARACASPD